MASRVLRVREGERPCDCCDGESLIEVGEALPSISHLFLPAPAARQISLRPTLCLPQAPVGGYFAPGALEVVGADFFDRADFVDGSDVLVPPHPTIEPPLERLAAAVEAEIVRSTAESEAHPDELPSTNCLPLRELKESILRELADPELLTLRMSKGGLGILGSRHPPHLRTSTVPQSAAVVDENSALGEVEVTFEFCERMTQSRVKERWSVLGCQSLLDLFAKLQCPSDHLAFAQGTAAFFFLGGCFYVSPGSNDDDDACANIRDWRPDPSMDPPFGCCPVLSMATPVGALIVRIGEKGVLRHNGVCDHVLSVVNVSRVEDARRAEYPRKLPGLPNIDRVTNCDLCRALPASVMTYFDPLAPTHPALYCTACFALMHGEQAMRPEEARTGELAEMVIFRLPAGTHF